VAWPEFARGLVTRLCGLGSTRLADAVALQPASSAMATATGGNRIQDTLRRTGEDCLSRAAVCGRPQIEGLL
jgi:hypothetical protein